MGAPVKVLIFCICVVVVFILIVLFNFDLIKFHTANSNETPPAAENATKPGASVANAPSSALKMEDLNLENGKKLYDAKTCVLCHGADGKANTPMGKAVGAADLTVEKFAANKKNLPRLDYILQVIENGVPGTGMVSFKAQIPSEKDRADLAGYADSLAQQK